MKKGFMSLSTRKENLYGASGMITISIITLFDVFIFYKNRNNLWILILMHGLFDTWGVTYLYFGASNPVGLFFEQLLLN